MVKIRLRRTGAKKKPQYRVVVADSRTPRDGRFIEIIGHYNPREEPVTLKVAEDRALYWLSVGAQPTDTVKKLFQNLGTLDRFARLREGADLEELVAEAVAARENRTEAEVNKAPAPAKTKSAKAEKEEVKEETVEEETADSDESVENEAAEEVETEEPSNDEEE